MRTGQVVTRGMLRILAVCALIGSLIVMHHLAADAAGGGAGDASHDVDVAANPTGTDSHGHASHISHTGHASAAGADSGEHVTHSLLHLCVAAVVSAALILMGWLLIRRAALGWAPVRRAGPRRWSPPLRPPRTVSGGALLISLCVMRT